ncbi:SGNH/GDSL hydrolase family protein [Enterobacter cloacae]|uniref:SGNH/GDSL hydrolase family protein n=1 Tax=Enterobacter cloacae TaxID=550 RepID=UPI0029C0FC5F|nr:GDSL-type esterase/lipase family protein [Enterobacter cloacae]
MKTKILIAALVASICVNVYQYSNEEQADKIESKRPSDMRIFQNTMLFFKEINARQADGDYIFFGDSLVQGMSPYALGIKYVNMGVGGYTVNWINALLERTDIKKYKAVIIEGGVNDALGGKGVEETRKGFEKYFKNASAAEKFYFVQTIPTVEKMHKGGNKLIEDLNVFTTKLCSVYRNCKLIPAPNELKKENNQEYYLPDGIHLNDKGYDVWTKQIKSHIN